MRCVHTKGCSNTTDRSCSSSTTVGVAKVSRERRGDTCGVDANRFKDRHFVVDVGDLLASDDLIVDEVVGRA